MSGARVCSKRGGVVRGGLVTAGVVAAAIGSASNAWCNTTRRLAQIGQAVTVNGESGWVLSALRDHTGAIAAPVSADTKYVVFNAQIRKGGMLANAIIRRNPDDSLSVVAKSDDAAGSGITFRTFGFPSVNDFGFVAFPATVGGAGVTTATDSGYWSTFSSATTIPPVLLLREGTGVSGGGVLSTFVDALVSRSEGSRWFSIRANLIGTGISSYNSAAIYGTDSGPVCELRVRGGAPAIGTPGAFADIKRVTNSRGDSLIYSTLAGTGITSSNNQGLWISDPGTDTPIFLVRTGAPALPPLSSSTFSALFAANATPQINDARAVVFRGTTVSASGVVGGGLWIYQANRNPSFQCIAASGQTFADLPGVTCTGPFTPVGGRGFYLGEDSSVLFWVGLSGQGVSAGNGVALMRSSEVGGVRVTRLVLRAGAPCPGTNAGVTLSAGNLGVFAAANRDAEIALWTRLQGPGVTPADDEAMLICGADGVRMVARKGQVVPGTGNAVLGALPIPVQIYHNRLGQVVFRGQLLGGNARAGGSFAFLSVDQHGSLRPIVGISMPFSVVGDANAVVSNLSWDARPLTDDGRFVFMGVNDFGGIGDGIFETQLSVGCAADVNGSGSVTVQDIFDFMADWSAGRGDFNSDGSSSVQDLFDFLTAWFSGC